MKRQKQTVPWAESRQKKLDRQEKKKRRKELKNKKIAEGIAKTKKRKNKFSHEEMDELMKDVALLRRHKKRKVRIAGFIFH